jgi:hypothetical protein
LLRPFEVECPDLAIAGWPHDGLRGSVGTFDDEEMVL